MRRPNHSELTIPRLNETRDNPRRKLGVAGEGFAAGSNVGIIVSESKPYIVTVDDDPEVLTSIERDLKSRYGKEYKIVRAESGEAALELIQQIIDRNNDVALVLADQRMPGMTGAELLSKGAALSPPTKRALLTAYADTEAAIQAINEARVHYYLMKPWSPPEELLYPVVDDLLGDWRSSYRPAFKGLRVVGTRWSPASHELRTFLGRHQISFLWLEAGRSEEADEIMRRVGEKAQLPLVVLPESQEVLIKPDMIQLAERLGFQTRATLPYYDLAIIGGGPAGLAAAVYGSSEGLNTVLIERDSPGGQASMSARIENYLGFPSGLTGADLARRATAQAQRFGVEMLTAQSVSDFCVRDGYKQLTLADGSTISAKAVIVATGVQYRKLEGPGLDELAGAGVYYGAAMSEGLACQGESVYVVGGANSAGQATVYLAGYASQVTMLVRGRDLNATMSQYLIDQIKDLPNVSIRFQVEVVGAMGDDHLEGLCLRDLATGAEEQVPASSVFVFIGAVPRTEWLPPEILRDSRGFVLAGQDLKIDGKWPPTWYLEREPFLLETSVPGVFVAGDVRAGSVKRVASGVGEGSIAVQFVHQYLAEGGR